MTAKEQKWSPSDFDLQWAFCRPIGVTIGVTGRSDTHRRGEFFSDTTEPVSVIDGYDYSRFFSLPRNVT